MDSGLAELRSAIEACPIIDNHAHNLLRSDKQDAYPFLGSLTEAHGAALNDYTHSLASYRALKQLRELYGCDETVTWDALLKKRSALLAADPDDLHRRCLADIHTILIDDGINKEDMVHSYKWHDRFTTGRSRRIVRIEALAADLMQAMYEQGFMPLSNVKRLDPTAIWPVYLQAFENAIADELSKPDVAGFKSVVCYRTGLDVVVAEDVTVAAAGQHAFREYLKSCEKGHYRIEHKGLNDCLVISACRLIAADGRRTRESKPFQFHTGLGDNDISLLRSNPAHMQPLIAAFPDVNFVILHSSYPYTREAGYLATVYKNAYLDIGEIFPMISIEGQVSAIKQSMELTPFSKLLWSTDAHHHPETYWLANKQIREVLFRVFKELLVQEVLPLSAASTAVHDIMFQNSNRLYNLNIRDPKASNINNQDRTIAASTSTAPHSDNIPAALPATVRNDATTSSADDGPHTLASYLNSPHGTRTKYFIVQWIDYMGTIRSRCFPVESFRKMIYGSKRFPIAMATLHVLQDDSLTPPVNTTGQMFAEPDLRSLRPAHPKDIPGATTLLSSFKKVDGSFLPQCPRGTLQSLADRLKNDHQLELLVGFEIEVTFLYRPLKEPLKSGPERHFTSIESTAAHAWSSLSAEQAGTWWRTIAIIVDELQSVGINLEHFESESQDGQYEFVMPPLPLLTAIDTLYQTKQAIQQKAYRYGLRATFHPTPLPGVGTGLHAHISLNKVKSSSSSPPLPTVNPFSSDSTLHNPSSPEAPFWSSVLLSLPAICAFTLASSVSYTRIGDDRWSGGTWVAWGTDNRETPLRRVLSPSGQGERWEVRCQDGMGNTYLGLAALVGAGIEGLERGSEMRLRDCCCEYALMKVGFGLTGADNPSRMTEEQRGEHGISERVPRSLDEALEALAGSEVMERVFGKEVVRDYILVRKAESEKLAAMTEEDRRIWLIQRY